MKKLKIALVATTMTLVSILGALAPQVAKADTPWPLDVVVSSSQARFEAQAIDYDETTNKYKYWFSWLMPAKRTYSFKIDGQMYNPVVTKNGTAETPFWFSPDITYTIQIFPYANGRGTMVAQGTFKAPSAIPSAPVTTRDSEAQIIAEYYYAAPDISNKKVSSPADVEALAEVIDRLEESQTISEIKSDWSSKTAELFAQTPLLLSDFDTVDTTNPIIKAEVGKVSIYKGKMNASLKVKLTDSKRKKTTVNYFFVKENGIWKIDIIQMLKLEIDKSI